MEHLLDTIVLLIWAPKETLLGFTLDFAIWLGLFTLGFAIKFNCKAREVWLSAFLIGLLATVSKTAVTQIPACGEISAFPFVATWIALCWVADDYGTLYTQARFEKRGYQKRLLARHSA